MIEQKQFCETFENYVENIISCDDNDYNVIVNAMNYSFLNGGKRIRPFLLGEFYKACGGNDNKYLNFAVALEMIHTYSLIHDDLPCMDNDDLRRGKPSNHKQFGQDIALLAGDALLTEAFYIAAQTEGIDAVLVKEAIRKLSYYAGWRGMIAGQIIDLSGENKQLNAKQIEKLNLLKTGALLKAACEIGCILAGADNDIKQAASLFGENIGRAFQLIDDILDATADEKLLGKPVGSDEKNNKSTFVSVYGIDYCKNKAEQLTADALKALDVFTCDTHTLKKLAEYLLERKY